MRPTWHRVCNRDLVAGDAFDTFSEREIGILLPTNQRQHRTLHIQEDVLPYALCKLLCPVSAALASIIRMNSISTSYAQPQALSPEASTTNPELLNLNPTSYILKSKPAYLNSEASSKSCSVLFGTTHYTGTSLIRTSPPFNPTVVLCLGPYGDPVGVGVSYERGTPVTPEP